jgi:hypothetical protein
VVGFNHVKGKKLIFSFGMCYISLSFNERGNCVSTLSSSLITLLPHIFELYNFTPMIPN